jgi:hypothetical protein
LARRKARQQTYCSARCAMRARSEPYRQQIAEQRWRLGDGVAATPARSCDGPMMKAAA